MKRDCPLFFVCFLFSLSIPDATTFNGIKNANFSQSSHLLKHGEFENKYLPLIEKKLLAKVDVNQAGGSASERIKASLLCPALPEGIFIDLHFGYCCGEVSTKEQNLLSEGGFGYDPMFYPLLTPKTSFASIPIEQKNKISHRAFAMEKFRHCSSSSVS